MSIRKQKFSVSEILVISRVTTSSCCVLGWVLVLAPCRQTPILAGTFSPLSVEASWVQSTTYLTYKLSVGMMDYLWLVFLAPHLAKDKKHET